jgi:hypothetical protein
VLCSYVRKFSRGESHEYGAIEREVITKSFLSPDELTPAEMWGAVAYFEGRLYNVQRTFRLYRDGELPEATWQSEIRSVPHNYGTPFGRLLWSELRAEFADDPEFIAAIDKELANPEVGTNDDWLRGFREKVAKLNLQSCFGESR